ncbi:expressed protein [Phakopsora pachyrhizi]|uniref:Expressed protein n=1 Tax=Phakopsora pachyrhizi TaxID=170000 RepID=A0AAV0AQW3_PHAPC|nr:expressed protein [Phakopsora pachyrhizi]
MPKRNIHKTLNAELLCSPVTAPDWYILYATQRLNIYFNTIYQATQDAIIFTQSITSTLYNELIPPKIINDAMDIAKASAGVGLGFEAIAFAIILVISSPGLLFLGAPFALMPVLSLEFTAAMVAAGIFITMSNIAFLDEITTLPGKKDLHFKIWSEVNFGIVEWQENIQKMISNMTTTVFNTPISSDSPYSLKEILKNGTFLEPFEPKNSYELEVDLRSYTMSMAASSLLRSINAFVVIDKIDNCANLDKKWNSKSRLSYCSPDGTWMKIIRTEPKSTKAINDMGNANVLHEKYNWTTEYISNTSFNCQLKYGAGKRKIDIVMEKNLNILKDPKECAFDLPVCDLRQGNSRKLKHKHHRTVEVCRDYLGLPI